MLWIILLRETLSMIIFSHEHLRLKCHGWDWSQVDSRLYAACPWSARAQNNKKKFCISEAEWRRTINYENRCKDLNGLLHPVMDFFFLFDTNDLWSDRVQLSLLPFCLAFWLRGEGQEFRLWAFVSAECGSISLSALFTSLSIKGLSTTN